MASSDAVLKVGGKTITLADVIARAKINGTFAQTAFELARDAAATQAAKDLDVTIDDKELQKAYDDFRRACQLHKAKDTQAWLERSQLKVEDIENYLEANLLRPKIAQASCMSCDRPFHKGRTSPVSRSSTCSTDLSRTRLTNASDLPSGDGCGRTAPPGVSTITSTSPSLRSRRLIA